jgi:hypothetical protein
VQENALKRTLDAQKSTENARSGKSSTQISVLISDKDI